MVHFKYNVLINKSLVYTGQNTNLQTTLNISECGLRYYLKNDGSIRKGYLNILNIQINAVTIYGSVTIQS